MVDHRPLQRLATAALILFLMAACSGSSKTAPALGALVIGPVVATGADGYVLMSVTDMPSGGLAAIQFGSVGDEGIAFGNVDPASITVEGRNGFIVLADDFLTNPGKGTLLAANATTGVVVGEILRFTFKVTGPNPSFVLVRSKVTLASDTNVIITAWNLSTIVPSPGAGASGGSYTSLPVADAGPDQTVCVGQRVYLDGSRSYDPDAGQPVTETQALPHSATHDIRNHAGLSFRWGFSVSYYAAGEAVLAIPATSHAAMSLEGEGTLRASFIPDKPGDYFLTLTVTDADGASTDQVRVTAVVPHTESQWFAEGWNLLSLPLVPVESKASATLGPTAGGTSFYSFSEGYRRVATLEPMTGYWLYLQEAQTLTVRGRQITTDVNSTFAKAGWHLIGPPFAIRWEDIRVLIDGVQVPVSDASSARHIRSEVFAYLPSEGAYFTSDVLLPWQGYWVQTKVDCVTVVFRAQHLIPESKLADLREPRGSEVPPPPPAFLAPADLEARVYPVPVSATGVVHFLVDGVSEVEAVWVRVFDISGTLLWQAEAPGISLDWPVTDDRGSLLANGPYAYRIDVSTNGRWNLLKRGVLFVMD